MLVEAHSEKNGAIMQFPSCKSYEHFISTIMAAQVIIIVFKEIILKYLQGYRAWSNLVDVLMSY